MSQVNINQLYDSINKKKLQKYKTYDDILKRCHARIKIYAENLLLQCFYDVPFFILGTPLYNINELKKYIIESLTKNGFQVMNLQNNWIYVSWDLKKSKRVNIKKIETEYKNIQDYNPTGTFIYNEKALNDIQEKSKILFNF